MKHLLVDPGRRCNLKLQTPTLLTNNVILNCVRFMAG